MDPLGENLLIVLKRIENACRQCGRSPAEVRLLMAAKTVPPERIKAAFEAGQTLMGENKVQEIKEKYDALKEIPHELHFIGHLQSKKIKDILKYGVQCVQSLDRLSLAEKLQQRLQFENRHLKVFIQVNTSEEESKFGVSPDEAVNLVKQVAALDRLHIRGLMTIGLFSTEAEKVRPCFQKLKRLQSEIRALEIPGVEMNELSMGMSNDLEIAVAEGATIVRVGTAIFGKRKYPDSYYWDERQVGS